MLPTFLNIDRNITLLLHIFLALFPNVPLKNNRLAIYFALKTGARKKQNNTA